MKEVAKKDRSIRQILTEGIRGCQTSLIGLSTILEILLEPNKPRPCVIQQVKVTAEDLAALKLRVNQH